jgi:hypothetical protein
MVAMTSRLIMSSSINNTVGKLRSAPMPSIVSSLRPRDSCLPENSLVGEPLVRTPCLDSRYLDVARRSRLTRTHRVLGFNSAKSGGKVNRARCRLDCKRSHALPCAQVQAGMIGIYIVLMEPDARRELTRRRLKSHGAIPAP